MAISKFRDMRPYREQATSLTHVALVPEVQKTLLRWVASVSSPNMVLIGGLAMSFYSPPRETIDVDLLFLTDQDIPEVVSGFRKHRKGAFEEHDTRVEVETTTPKSINIDIHLAKKVIETAVTHEGLKVASLSGLIALKLVSSLVTKRSLRDLGDIQILVNAHPTASIDGWPLSDDLKERFNSIKKGTFEIK